MARLGRGYSARVQPLAQELYDPGSAPPGKQWITVDASGGLAGVLAGSNAATGDTLEGDLVTNLGYSITFETDGDFEIDAGGDASPDFFEVRVYDLSDGTWSDPFLIYVHNQAPRLITGTTIPVETFLFKDVAMTALLLTDVIIDPEGDAQDITNTGSYPTGITESSNYALGTPTVAGVNRPTIRSTDPAGNYVEYERAFVISPYGPRFSGSVSDLTLATNELMTPIDYSAEFVHDSGSLVGTTFALKQVATSGSVVTTANGASQLGRALKVVSAASISVGDYVSTESNPGVKCLVKAKYTNELVLDRDTIWASGDDITSYSAGAGSVTGLSLSSAGVLSGTPTVNGITSNVVVRATDGDGDTADSTVFTITCDVPTFPDFTGVLKFISLDTRLTTEIERESKLPSERISKHVFPKF